MAGLSSTGLVIKRLEEIIAGQKEQAQILWQDQVGPGDVVDVSDNTALGRILLNPTLEYADLWEAVQQVYDSFNPNAAVGVSLDNLIALSAITRLEESASTTEQMLAGTTGTVIPAGSVVSSTGTGARFASLASVTLDRFDASGVAIEVLSAAAGTFTITLTAPSSAVTTITETYGAPTTAATVLADLKDNIDTNHVGYLTATISGSRLIVTLDDPFRPEDFQVTSNLSITKVYKTTQFECEEIGPVEQAVNSVTTIATPVLGWDSTYNILSASVGRFLETDEELRLRFYNSKFTKAINLIEALYSAIYEVDGVEQVIVYENDTNTTDSNGLPAHSFMALVRGGINSVIAQSIWENKPVGITSSGTTSVNITDSNGGVHTVSFQRPDPKPTYIELDISTDSNFPEGGEELIKDAIIQYYEDNYGIGDNVIYSRLYTPINSVAGHVVNSFLLDDVSPPVASANVTIAFDEIATIARDDIVINIT